LFIVMNRFQINQGHEADFEAMWQSRERHLDEFEGFVNFSLLKNETSADGTTEYISHTIWATRDNFEVWRNSDAFRSAHAGAPVTGVIAGPPHASLYDAVIEEHNAKLARV
jgi:heme-degrading monooxygenase HmoA